jgi:3-(3-hydroxy-phenyl)propionate hydroxylase
MRRSHRRRRLTGVTLALLLARQGVSVIVAEKEAEVYPLPRAAHLDHEIIRVFQEVGAAEAIVRSSRQSSRYDFLNAAGEILLRFTGSDRIGPGGWPAANMIHQPSVERVLRDRLADYPAPGWSALGGAVVRGRTPMA